MMPAFALAEGGPLDDQQINALAEHLNRTIPSRAGAAPAAAGGGGSGTRH